MIVKNISITIQEFPGLGGLRLMPGEQQDISNFSQRERDNSYELQEAFRKGDLICIGVGKSDRPDIDPKMRVARARFMEKIEEQPLLDDRHEQKETLTHEDERTGVTIIDNPHAFITMNEEGVTQVQHIVPPPKTPPPPKPPVEHPTITPERAREILSQQCLGTRTNGRECRRRAVKGYEHCLVHMPPEIKAEYKRRKKQQFFD